MSTSDVKKAIIKKRIELGDKRDYNQIAADLELAMWTARFKDDNWMAKQKITKVNELDEYMNTTK